MDRIFWTEGFSVGVAEMDRQHKKLIAMINRLSDEPGTTTNSVTISDLLNDMIRYALEHFRDEEALLAEHDYPFKDQQKEQHKSFVKKTVDFCSAVEVGIDVVPQVMLEYLKDWLIHHILEQDMKYKSFLRDQGIS